MMNKQDVDEGMDKELGEAFVNYYEVIGFDSNQYPQDKVIAALNHAKSTRLNQIHVNNAAIIFENSRNKHDYDVLIAQYYQDQFSNNGQYLQRYCMGVHKILHRLSDEEALIQQKDDAYWANRQKITSITFMVAGFILFVLFLSSVLERCAS